jgi:hypothetical protein
MLPPLKATERIREASTKKNTWADISPIASRAAVSEPDWISKEAMRLAKAISSVITGRHKINKYPMLLKQKLIEEKSCCIFIYLN